MARIASVEEVEGLRDEQDIGDQFEPIEGDEDSVRSEVEEEKAPKPITKSGKYVATLREVQDSFDSVNTLRYSQPAHLQGMLPRSSPIFYADPPRQMPGSYYHSVQCWS